MLHHHSNAEDQAYHNPPPLKTHRLYSSTTHHHQNPLPNQEINRGKLRHGGSPSGCRQAKSPENVGYAFPMRQKTIPRRQIGDHRALAHLQLMKRVSLTGWLRRNQRTAGLQDER